MSTGRWIMRSRVFQTRAFAPWALAGSGSTVPDIDGNPVVGWSLGYNERVFSVHGNLRVFDAGYSTRVFDVEKR